MDDDLSFGASVWGTSEPVNIDLLPPVSTGLFRIPDQPSLQSPHDSSQFSDDFDNFATPAESIGASDDEEFGDFGDFGEAQMAEGSAFDDADFGAELAGSLDWQLLKLDPLPSRAALRQHITEILRPLWAENDSDALSDESIREMEGITQVLVTPERYLVFNAFYFIRLRASTQPRIIQDAPAASIGQSI